MSLSSSSVGGRILPSKREARRSSPPLAEEDKALVLLTATLFWAEMEKALVVANCDDRGNKTAAGGREGVTNPKLLPRLEKRSVMSRNFIVSCVALYVVRGVDDCGK